MKYVFFLLITIFIISCESLFHEEKHYVDSEYYLYSINPDGTSKEEIIRLDIYATTIRISPDGQKIAARGVHGQVRLIYLPTNDTIMSYSGIFTKPSFSHNSQNLIFAKQNKIMRYNIENNQMDSLIVSGTINFPIYSPNDEYIIFSNCKEINSDYLISLIRINIDGSEPDTLYSYTSNVSDKIYYPTFMPSGEEIYFIAQESLQKININGSGHYNFNIEIDSSPISISPNGNLIVGTMDFGDDILLISSDGMDTSILYSGRYLSFVSNQEIVFFDPPWDIFVGKLDGSGYTKITKGRFPVYCNALSKIFYLKVKEIYE